VTKPQRAALAAVPVLSLGLLSWLPLLYLYLRDPAKRARPVLCAIMLACTAILVWGLVTTEEGTGRSMAYGVLYLWMIALASVLAWLESRPQVAPAKDPYA
jgi:hypothetical protein